MGRRHAGRGRSLAVGPVPARAIMMGGKAQDTVLEACGQALPIGRQTGDITHGDPAGRARPDDADAGRPVRAQLGRPGIARQGKPRPVCRKPSMSSTACTGCAAIPCQSFADGRMLSHSSARGTMPVNASHASQDAPSRPVSSAFSASRVTPSQPRSSASAEPSSGPARIVLCISFSPRTPFGARNLRIMRPEGSIAAGAQSCLRSLAAQNRQARPLRSSPWPYSSIRSSLIALLSSTWPPTRFVA